LRGLRRITILAAVLAIEAASGAAVGTAPAFAQSAGTAGVAAGKTSSGAGELVVTGTQQQFLPRGINSVGLLYPDALSYSNTAEQQYFDSQCSGVAQGNQQELTAAWTAMTTNTDTQLLAMEEHWQANTVRFHVSQGALAYENENGLSQYTDAVGSVIRQARAMGLVVMVDVDAEQYGCTPAHNYPAGGSGLPTLPTGKTKEAWTQLLPQLGNDPGMILEPMNEPDVVTECGTGLTTQQLWADWASGCGSPDIGMVNLGTWLRGQAPDNLLLFDGNHFAGTFDGFIAASSGMPANSAYAVHPFYYVDGPTAWGTRFGNLEAASSAGGQGQAVVANAWNRSLNCSTSPNELSDAEALVGDPQTGTQGYLSQHNIGLSMQSWDAPQAQLVNLPLSTSNGHAADPVDSLAATGGCSFTGASMVYNEYWAQAGVSVATPAVQVSPPLIWNSNAVDGVTVALADNGSPFGTSPVVPPQVVSSVNVLVQKAGSQAGTWVAQMTLSGTGPWWDNGSYTLASVSGLSGKSVTAGAGDTLIFRVRYQGVSGYQDTSYLVPPQ
jgi:hypothetical protein